MTTGPTDILPWLRKRRAPLLVSHQRPDGDALGSLAGMGGLLRALGMSPTIALFDALPPRYRLLAGTEWSSWEPVSARFDAFDALLILDTCSASQLEPLVTRLAAAPPTLVIDHHATRDEIGTRAGDLRFIDVSASACALLVAEWADGAALPLTPAIAAALFVGIATDCGWFRFSNTDARTFQAVSRLVSAGVRPDALYQQLYQCDPLPRARLAGRLLTALDLRASGLLAVMKLRQSDFAAAGADRTMTEDLVNEAARLGGVEATALFSEDPDGRIRINLRSRNWLDVAAVAAELGGGGHARAAGARATGDFETVVAQVVARLEQLLRAAPRST
ncbi:MAG: Bifunctional oligoribonuclease and PAP phosphatase NrnA [Phycisphaerae bacterium]|nr:Bifunctional oligoribonuclease and PAP phosphatase NrnA [Phycisphaerae bacterium]